jgi:integral membrane protein (TIGR01906 family)
VLGFGVVFVGFHRLFFEGSSWIFPLSDTFIRLYPERFWRDTFVLVVLITGVLTAITYLVGRRSDRPAGRD